MNDRIQPSDFVVKAKVKAILKENEMNGSAELYGELGHAVTRTLKSAIRRAQANKRKTVKACDV